jgi:hypothetical protein
MQPPNYLPLWQVVGMFVLVYAPGLLVGGPLSGPRRAPDPDRHGKLLGPIGFLWAYASDDLPLRFGLILVFNDLIWYPAFRSYLQRYASRNGGWVDRISGATLNK